MTITWINCAERMPPNTEDLVIVSDLKLFYVLPGININGMCAVAILNADKWTEFTQEKWEYLNK